MERYDAKGRTAVVRAGLSAGLDAELDALRRLRPWRRFVDVAVFLSFWALGILIVLAAPLVPGHLWSLRLVGMVLCAVAINAFFLLTHEGHHGLLARRPAVNHAVNLLLSLPLLTAPTAYRVLHDLHHDHLGGPGDPDEYRNYTGHPMLLWALHWFRFAFGTVTYMFLIPIVAWQKAAPHDRRVILFEYGALGTVWAAVFLVLPLPELLLAWIVPGLAVGYFSAIRALAQHVLTDPADPLLASRTITTNRFVSFLLLHENHHLEHHLFPEVPSYHLARLRALVSPRLPYAVESRTYTRFFLGFLLRTLRRDHSTFGQTVPASVEKDRGLGSGVTSR